MSSNDFDRVTAAAIEGKIFALLANRRAGATICPSEVARSLVPHHGPWRELMPQVRQVAQALARTNRLTVTRGGATVDATSPGGPVRLGQAIRRDDP
ncbi:MAG: DUF3253 domain-containing protein [Burkholderiales bacterium]|nr:DUF3253 domain-containing protein [Burkholderiales bacterium]